MPESLYYDRCGQPITIDVLEEKLGDPEYKRVAETTVGEHWVSTVWLGIDHNLIGAGPPLIFETMVFPESDPVRAPTEAAALATHDQVVADVRSGRFDCDPETHEPGKYRLT